jgi:hypothetical protein
MLMKKKVIAAAVAATLGHTVVNAVSVNTDGLGQVLLFPYYTVQGSDATNNFDTLISIVNTTDEVKAVKIRFREAKASHEVLDFNIYMSPKDVWVAVISPDAGGGAKIATPDNTCTVPAIPAGGVAFRNSEYNPPQGVDDGAGTGLDRTREGYFEVIEMGVVNDTDANPPASTVPSPFLPATWATHVNGVPGDCASLNAAWAGGSWTNFPAGFTEGDLNVTAPTGGLFGSVSLVNVNEGTDYGYDAVALNDFFVPADMNDDLHRDPGNNLPTLADVDPKISVVVNGNTVVNSTWGLSPSPVDPVSAVLMKTKLMNDFATDPGIDAATSLVYTMPTKTFYVPIGTGLAATPPFTTSFFGSACENVAYTVWDREEQTEIPITNVDFSPRPVTVVTPSALCFEANVVRINGKDALSSSSAMNDLSTVFVNGWVSADMGGSGHSITDDANLSYIGLPVIGFSAQRYFNGTLAGNSTLSNYGGLFNHKSMTVLSN